MPAWKSLSPRMYCTCAKRCQSKYNTPKLILVITTSQRTLSKCFCSNVNADLYFIFHFCAFSSLIITFFSQWRREEFIFDTLNHFTQLVFFYLSKFFQPRRILSLQSWNFYLSLSLSFAPVFMWTSSPSLWCTSLICPHWSVLDLVLYCEFRHHVEPQQCVSVWIFLLRHHWSSRWTTRLVH